MATRAFDPLLDPRAQRLQPTGASSPWPAHWIWYPGQLAAHLHAKGMAASMRRCTNIGYPGNFRQPLHVAHFRRSCSLTEPTTIRWAGPICRMHLNGGGQYSGPTQRQIELPAGDFTLSVTIDFSESLPCLLLHATAIATGPGWEASLDGQTWVPAEFESAQGAPDSPPDSARELTLRLPPDRIAHLSHATQDGDRLTFQDGGEALIDFFHDELGQLRFRTHGDGQLQFHVAESIPAVEDQTPAHQEQLPLPAVPASSDPANHLLPERCVRYVKIRSTGTCTVDNLHLDARVHPVEYRGHFECDDNLLNQIWSASAATVHACMHSFYLDGLLRDALPWAADGVGTMEAGDCVFFDEAIARNTMVSQMLPDHPKPSDTGIIDYCLYVILGLEHDYLMRGDLSFSQHYRPRITELLELFRAQQDEHGFVSATKFQGHFFLPDWAQDRDIGPDLGATPTYAQMLLMRAFEIGAAFSHRWGDSAQANQWSAMASKMRQNIRDLLWDPSAGAYASGFDNQGRLDRRLTSFAQVWGIHLGLMTAAEAALVVDRVLTNPACRTKNLSFQLPWEYRACHKAGRMAPVLDQLRHVWGKMLATGSSRFWEDIRPDDDPRQALALYGRPYANSLCHAWAGAAPILALSRGILGISSTGPGYATCQIAPQLAGLKWARGNLPTPRGPISLDYHEFSGGTLTLPPGVSAALVGCVTTDGRRQVNQEGTIAIRPSKEPNP